MAVRVVDAVVVGAGHNGLVAAALLADARWDVLVLEAQPTPGGAVRSAQVAAPGFEVDLFSAFYPLGAGSPVLQGLELERHGLEWSHAPLVLAHPFPDGRCAVLSRDPEETAASVGAWAAPDHDAWLRCYAEWERIGAHVIDAIMRPFPPVQPGLRLWRQLGAAGLLRLARFGVLPVRRYVQEEFRGDGARLLVAGNAMHTDLSPEGAGSAVFGWLLAMLGQQVGFPAARGGASRIAEALARRLQAAGGQLQCNARVEQVLIRGGRATGVRTQGGDTVVARRAVLADVDAPGLYRDLVGLHHLPAPVRRDLDRFQWDNATLKVNWALSAPIPWTAEAARRAGTVHVGADLDGLTRHAGDLAQRRLPAAPFLLVGQMTTADPTRSPSGTESAWAYTHLPRDAATGDHARRFVEKVEDVMEQHAPGFRSLIVGRHVQGPGDIEGADANLSCGAVNAGTASIHQQLVFRPTPGLARPETPVEGLYLAGASAHPGGGVHGACGSNAAHAALARARVGGRAYGLAWRSALRAVQG